MRLSITYFQIHITEEEAAEGVTILGGAAFIGVLLICAISQLEFDRLIVQVISCTVYGVISILVSYVTNKVIIFSGLHC